LKYFFKISLFLFCVNSVSAQLATGIFIGSQNMRHNKEIQQNAFSFSTELSYQGPRWWGRLFYRSILPKNTIVSGYYDTETPGNYYTYERYAADMEVNYRENILGASIAVTFSETNSKSRPYLMFEMGFSKINLNINAPDSAWQIGLGGDQFTRGLNKGGGLHVRFTSGMQFRLKPDLCLTTEASYAGGMANSIYDATTWAVDVGLRWFFVDKIRVNKKY
jgi:hypothetical protein